MCRVHFLLYFNFAVCVTGGYIVSFWVDNIVADVSKLGLTIMEAACEKDEEEEERGKILCRSGIGRSFRSSAAMQR